MALYSIAFNDSVIDACGLFDIGLNKDDVLKMGFTNAEVKTAFELFLSFRGPSKKENR